MGESSDSKVEIRFPIQVNGHVEFAELPFVIGVLGDFAGIPPEPLPLLKSRKFVEVDADNFDDVLAAFSPRLFYKAENRLKNDGSELEVELKFKCLADFDAENIARQIEPLRRLIEELENQPDTNGLDEIISAQLDSIILHQAFKDLESAWRGLYYLVKNINRGAGIKVKVIHALKKDFLKESQRIKITPDADFEEILSDFERHYKISDASLFKRLYDDVFNAYAGEPFGVLIGNYEFDFNSSQDIFALSYISKFAALAHAPFIAGASPQIFDYEYFLELQTIRFRFGIGCRMEHRRWQKYRETEESKYGSLCLPRFLLREKYANENSTTQNFSEISEEVKFISEHLWGNAAFAFGTVLARAFAKNKWLGRIDGDEFGLIESVPAVNIPDEHSRTLHSQSPIDLVLSEIGSRLISIESFNIIAKKDGEDKYFFFSANSCKKFKPVPDPRHGVFPVDVNLQTSSSLPVTFAVSRFVHYLIKIIKTESARQKRSAIEWQQLLNNWICRYCADPQTECSAQRPLSQARIEVEESNTDGFGRLTAKFYIKPGYQMPEIKSACEIVFSDF